MPASGRRPDGNGGHPGRRDRWAAAISFRRLKWASFAHSAIYAALLSSWAADWTTGRTVFGWGHGLGWFVMCGLAIAGLRRGVIPLYVAVCVAVVGAVGPFVGTASFIHAERREKGGIVHR